MPTQWSDLDVSRAEVRDLPNMTKDIHRYVPHVRPHIHRRDQKLFFMISRRPVLELATEEVVLYESIDGRKTVGELEDQKPGAIESLLCWHKAEILELIPPISPPEHPHIVVVEPHMDDAALSVGGRLLHRRGHCRITILSMMRQSNFTSYLTVGRDFTNVAEISKLRTQESELSAGLLGAKHSCLGWDDAPLRLWPAERWSAEIVQRFKQEPQLFTNFVPEFTDVSKLAHQLLSRLTELHPDELWIPMGLGNHLDHRSTRSACLLLLSQKLPQLNGVRVSMYEDLPYASTPGHSTQIRAALAAHGTQLVRQTEDVTDVFTEKVRAISVFASQFKISHMEPGIRQAAMREGQGNGHLCEVYHQVEGDVTLPSEFELSRECEGLVKLESGTKSVIKKRAKSRSVTVIVLPSGSLAKWRTGWPQLQRAFPNASFLVYAPADLSWQIEERPNGKIMLEFVPKRLMQWIGVLSREFLKFRTPTIVLWRGAYASLPRAGSKKIVNLLLRCSLPFRRVLFARTLQDISSIFNQQLSHADALSIDPSKPRGLHDLSQPVSS